MSIRSYMSNLLYKLSKPISKNARIHEAIREFEYVLLTRFKLSDVKSCSFCLKEHKLTFAINSCSEKTYLQSFDAVFTPDMLSKMGKELVCKDYHVLFYCDENDALCGFDVFIPPHKKHKTR